MKQVCCRPLCVKRWGLVLFTLLLFLVAVTLSSCWEKPAATPTAPTTGVDRTQAGTAPGQVTSGEAQTIYGRAVQKAIGDNCREYLKQVRTAIMMYKSTHEAYPPTLAALNGEGGDPLVLSCPVGHEQYSYDSATGEVHCVHQGHEKY